MKAEVCSNVIFAGISIGWEYAWWFPAVYALVTIIVILIYGRAFMKRFLFDTVVKLSKGNCRKALTQNGTFISTTGVNKNRTEDLIFLKKLIEVGKLKLVIDRSYPLEQIVEAHRYVEAGRSGKVVKSYPSTGVSHQHCYGKIKNSKNSNLCRDCRSGFLFIAPDNSRPFVDWL